MTMVTAQSELLTLRAAWLTRLPAACTLACTCEGQALLVTTSKHAFAVAQRLRVPVAHGEHWVAMVDAAAGNRAALACRQWLLRSEWIHPLSLFAALGTMPAQPRLDVPSCKLTVAQVLEHFALELREVDPPLEQLRGAL